MSKPWLKSWEDLSVEEAKSYKREKADFHHKSRYDIVRLCTDVGGNVLDCGFGSGIMFELFKSTEIDYWGIDAVHNFVKACHELYPEAAHRFQLGDILALPFETNQFTTVFCRSVLEHLPPHLVFTAISEMVRVASKQIILDFHRPPWDKRTICYFYREGRYANTYNKREIIDYIRLAGGSIEDIFENVGENKVHAIYQVRKYND